MPIKKEPGVCTDPLAAFPFPLLLIPLPRKERSTFLSVLAHRPNKPSGTLNDEGY
jgi:hypothetical protein